MAPKHLLTPSSMENGTLAPWLKQVGDRVTTGEIVADVESDKASMEIEAPCDGVLVAIEVTEGAPRFTPDAVLGTIAL